MAEINYLNEEEINENEEDMDDLDIESSYEKKNKKSDSNKQEKDTILISKSKLAIISRLLDNIKESHDRIVDLMAGTISSEDEARISIGQMESMPKGDSEEDDESRIVEGVFDGENMIGPDGRQYSVPANYASKSKLVEGDILKLTITSKGTFVYKQIGPIERERVIGRLHQIEGGAFVVKSDNKEWKVLTASVTYYKGRDNDEIVILIPKVGESKWAAVENIVRKTDR